MLCNIFSIICFKNKKLIHLVNATCQIDEIVKITESLGVPINLENNEDLQKIVRSTIGTKFSSKWGDLLVDLAV